MADHGGRGLGFLFGVLGGILVVVQGLIDLVRSAFYLAVGHPFVGLGWLGATVVLVILGLVFIAFAAYGASRTTDRALAAGVVLLVIALLGLVLLGFGNGIIGLLGTVFVIIAGLLYIVAGR